MYREENQKCKSCQWWDRGAPSFDGQCRAYPPKATFNQRIGKLVTLVPETSPDHWCGSWVPSKDWSNRQLQKQQSPQNQVRPEAGGCPACRDTGVLGSETCPCRMDENVKKLEFNRDSEDDE
jgi:hypothetical protein